MQAFGRFSSDDRRFFCVPHTKMTASPELTRNHHTDGIDKCISTLKLALIDPPIYSTNDQNTLGGQWVMRLVNAVTLRRTDVICWE